MAKILAVDDEPAILEMIESQNFIYSKHKEVEVWL